MFGPYESASGPIAAPGGPLGALYAGKLLERQAGTWQFMASRSAGDRDFLGELTDPLPVTYEADGHLLVEYPRVSAGADR
jgi:beta-fructofuranosidase